jgi:hypothetical protein
MGCHTEIGRTLASALSRTGAEETCLVFLQRPLALFAGENRAPGTLYARGMHVLGVVFEVHEYHLLGYLVQDVPGSLATPLAETLLAAQLLWQTVKARQSVGTEYAHD